MSIASAGGALLILLLSIVPAAGAGAQGEPRPASGELYKTITALDSALFEAYNACDLAKLGSFFAEDVEFYHDAGGLTTSRQAVLAAIENNVCGRVRRELVAGTIEVYPVPGYGAIETGTHRFYNRSGGTEEGGAPVKVSQSVAEHRGRMEDDARLQLRSLTGRTFGLAPHASIAASCESRQSMTFTPTSTLSRPSSSRSVEPTSTVS